MQIELIDTFLDLCDTRSFNRTAERLGITQSTVSGRIKALEAAIGQRLFLRSRAGPQLTGHGLRFEPHARSLRFGWVEARHAVSQTGGRSATFRFGIQSDLVGSMFAGLAQSFRASFPETAFLFEADYSAQMCVELANGTSDLAILYSPRYNPDLYFDTLGTVRYTMVSTLVDTLDAIDPETYIQPNYSDAFPHAHAALHPLLGNAALTIGHNAAMVELLKSAGGTGYVMATSADDLIRQGLGHAVRDAAPIDQTVYVGVNQRNRHRAVHKRLMHLLRQRFAEEPQAG